MNWEERAKWEAIGRFLTTPIPTAQETRMPMPFIWGARWQRDQLRTNEAIERVARSIARLEPGEEWPDGTIIDDEYRDECYETAFAAIDALLGDN